MGLNLNRNQDNKLDDKDNNEDDDILYKEGKWGRGGYSPHSVT